MGDVGGAGIKLSHNDHNASEDCFGWGYPSLDAHRLDAVTLRVMPPLLGINSLILEFKKIRLRASLHLLSGIVRASGAIKNIKEQDKHWSQVMTLLTQKTSVSSALCRRRVTLSSESMKQSIHP